MKRPNKDKGAVPKISIQIDPETEKGIYSNYAAIMHSQNEFLLDFTMALPGKQAWKVVARVIHTPRAAKQLMLALTENVKKYEAKFGEIQLPQPPPGVTGPGHPPVIN